MAWDADSLCSLSDFIKEFGEQPYFVLNKEESAKQSEIEEAIKQSGSLVTNHLLSFLPDIYAGSMPVVPYEQYLLDSGLTYANLDGMLDRAQNPEAMKDATVSRTGIVLLNKYIRAQKSAISNVDIAIKEREDTEKQYKIRFDYGYRSLKLDLNEDGIVTDSERPRTRNSFNRI